MQNLVYDKLPQFERRLIQLENMVQELLSDQIGNIKNKQRMSGQGAIQLQTTPRHFEDT